MSVRFGGYVLSFSAVTWFGMFVLWSVCILVIFGVLCFPLIAGWRFRWSCFVVKSSNCSSM